MEHAERQQNPDGDVGDSGPVRREDGPASQRRDAWPRRVGLVRADVAQLVEHSLGKGEVTSSILVIGSRDLGAGIGGSNSVVESQPSKLLVAGSIPVSRSINLEA